MRKFSAKPVPSAIYIIGAGGVGSYLVPPLVKLLAQIEPATIPLHLVDGDTLEARNLDRQLFRPDLVGENKAAALRSLLADSYPRTQIHEEYFVDGFNVEEGSLFFGCVDNHPARRSILSTVDRTQGWAILGGNELTDAEAFYYRPEWRGSGLDPRVYYPEILTRHDGDPMRQAIGCTGEALIATPQLAMANLGAAYYMLHLFWFWFIMEQELQGDPLPISPVKHFNNFSRVGTMRGSDFDIYSPKNQLKGTNHE